MYPKWKMDPPKKVNFSKISKFWATLTPASMTIEAVLSVTADHRV